MKGDGHPLDLDVQTSPAWLPIRRVGDTVEAARLDESAYRDASFLDGRVLQAHRVVPAPWAELCAVAPRPRRIHFIFHIGHCGSTLFSRLLGEHPALFSVREPGLLRDLAQGQLPPGALDVLLGLYGRVWRDRQTALIKATSFVSEIGPELLDRAGGRALLLGVTPPAYLRGILAGPNARQEAVELAALRQARLERRFGRPFAARSEGERIALSWLCEASALHAMAQTHPSACLRLDFDAFLAAPADGLAAALAHLEVDAEAMDIPAVLDGPLMRRYAKGPEHPYDAALRAALLAQALRDAGPQVRAGMDWLQREALADPRIAEVLVSAAAARRPLAPAVSGG